MRQRSRTSRRSGRVCGSDSTLDGARCARWFMIGRLRRGFSSSLLNRELYPSSPFLRCTITFSSASPRSRRARRSSSCHRISRQKEERLVKIRHIFAAIVGEAVFSLPEQSGQEAEAIFVAGADEPAVIGILGERKAEQCPADEKTVVGPGRTEPGCNRRQHRPGTAGTTTEPSRCDHRPPMRT